MFLGLCIEKDGIHHYCKPFILNHDNENNFIGQIIRDVDFSLFIKLNDIYELSIIVYPEKNSYYYANKNNINVNTFKVLTKCIFAIDNIEDIQITDLLKKGILRKKINETYDVNIEFYIMLTNNVDLILSTPFIKGHRDYLSEGEGEET
jgi:hypothetical protein